MSALADWFEDRIGREETSGWFTVTQDMIDRFAALSNDRYWIHTDPERAARESVFGTTIAHGFLVLSLITELFDILPEGVAFSQAVNYGGDRLRFPAPVRAGARIRGRRAVKTVEELADGAVKVTTGVEIAVEGEVKPACVYDSIVLYFP